MLRVGGPDAEEKAPDLVAGLSSCAQPFLGISDSTKTTVGSRWVAGAVPVPQTACSLALVESLLRNKEIH